MAALHRIVPTGKTKIQRAGTDLEIFTEGLRHENIRNAAPSLMEKHNTVEPIGDHETMMSGYNNQLAQNTAGSKGKNPFVLSVNQKLRSSRKTDKTAVIAKINSGNHSAVHPSDSSTTAAAWKVKYDTNQIYNLEKSLT